jgi:hypothetical protein
MPSSVFSSFFSSVTPLCCVCVLLSLSDLYAHHGTPTSRAGGGELTPSATWSDQASQSSFDTQVSLEHATWRSEGGQGVSLGALTTQRLTLSQRMRLTNTQTLTLTLPLGRFTREPTGGSPVTTTGLGDLSALYQLNTRTFFKATSPLTGSFIMGFTSPTGDYAPEQRLSDTALRPQQDGRLDVLTFNAQTSLGAGVWSATLGAQVQWRLTPSLALTQALYGALPLNNTPDGLRWGADLSSRLGARWWWSPRASVSVSALWARHLADEVPDSLTGARSSVGGRQELSATLSASLALTSRFECSAGGGYLAWVKVNTPQLVRRSYAQSACRLAW